MKEKKPCELCDNLATMYCESDRANLCWDCDSRVHGANFLVAKHSRTLLCRSCQFPTPWTASGSRLAPTVSVCEKCVNCRAGDDHGDSTRLSHGEGRKDDSDCDGDEENQVVPGGSSLVAAAAAAVAGSPSSSKDSRASALWKRSPGGARALFCMGLNLEPEETQGAHQISQRQRQRLAHWGKITP